VGSGNANGYKNVRFVANPYSVQNYKLSKRLKHSNISALEHGCGETENV